MPSILITNFTFDSVYSYLSTKLIDAPTSPHLNATHHTHHHFDDLIPDVPIASSEVAPLVEHIHAGYRCADLLLLLPGSIPVPSFARDPSLPAPDWVDLHSNKFHNQVVEHLLQPLSSLKLLPSIPFPASCALSSKDIPRKVMRAPLIVRPPTSSPSVYTSEGRSRLLSSIGVPQELQDPQRTRILIVSFGGQVFRKPSRSGSRTPSRRSSRDLTLELTPSNGAPPLASAPPTLLKEEHVNGLGLTFSPSGPLNLRRKNSLPHIHDVSVLPHVSILRDVEIDPHPAMSPRLATPSHIWIPGAPPASKPSLTTPVLSSPTNNPLPTFSTIPPTPDLSSDAQYFDISIEGNPETHPPEADEPRLLPDSSWIAIVCGVSKEQWGEDEGDSELPDGFFVAPRDVYMPDLTAVADVLLGKLVSAAVTSLLF